MTTLIAVYNSGGCVGRCDARCYEAREPGCACICGGRNHGAGKRQAMDNTRELAQSWVERARAAGRTSPTPNWPPPSCTSRCSPSR